MKTLRITAPLIFLISFFVITGFKGDKVITKLSTLEVTVLCNGVPYTGEGARVHIHDLETIEPLLTESTDPGTGIANFDVSSLAFKTYYIQIYSPCGNNGDYWFYDGSQLFYQIDVDAD